MKEDGSRKYDDMIYLPHHVSARHSQMPLSDRAAQFSPFAALTGHDEAIRETARLTESFAELDEEQKEQLDKRLQLLLAKMEEEPCSEPEIKATYFEPDARKNGGAYVSVCGKVKKMDKYSHQILFTDGTVLSMDKLFSMEGEMFECMNESISRKHKRKY